MKILRRDGIQGFGSCGQAQSQDVPQKLATPLQTNFYFEGIVEKGVIDQSLPAHRGSRLLKVDPHNQQQSVTHGLG